MALGGAISPQALAYQKYKKPIIQPIASQTNLGLPSAQPITMPQVPTAIKPIAAVPAPKPITAVPPPPSLGLPSSPSAAAQPVQATAQAAPPAAQANPSDSRQYALQRMGYTGQFGAGDADKWLDMVDPDRSKLKSEMGLVGNTQGPQGPGTIPLTTEPMNQTQKDALQKIITGAPDLGFGAKTNDSLQQVLQQIQGYTRGFDPTKDIDPYMNPYTDDVVTRNAADMNRQAEMVRNQIRDRSARLGNTGSSGEALQLATEDDNTLRSIGDMSANLRSQGYNNALAQGNTMRSNASNAAGLYGNLAGAYQNQDQYDYNKYYDTQGKALGAGNTIQDQNQKILDTVEQNRLNAAGYPYSQLEFLAKMLGSYPTGTTTTNSTPGNPIQGALGGGLLGSQLGPLFK